MNIGSSVNDQGLFQRLFGITSCCREKRRSTNHLDASFIESFQGESYPGRVSVTKEDDTMESEQNENGGQPSVFYDARTAYPMAAVHREPSNPRLSDVGENPLGWDNS